MPEQAVYCMMCGKKLISSEHKAKQRGNGQCTVYRLPNGKYAAEVTLYYYIDANGKRNRKRKTRQFEKKKDAVAALPELLSAEAAIKPPSLLELHEVFLRSKKSIYFQTVRRISSAMPGIALSSFMMLLI